MNKRHTYWRKVVASTVAYTLAVGQIAPSAYAASTDISDIPLAVKNQVAPNIMMTLDDSGSMQWEFLPEDLMGSSMWMYPRPSNPYGGSTYTNQVPNFNDNNFHNFFGRSSNNNKIYYNPDVTYPTWSNADGSFWPNATPTAALYNPALPGVGSLNLTAQKTESAEWFSGTGLNNVNTCDPCGSQAYWPITYFKYKGAGSIYLRTSYDRIEITSATPAATTYSHTIREADGTTSIGVRTRDQEIQNFANWFQYSRSRISAARAGIGRAFSTLGETPRVGFAAINTPAATIDGVSSPGTILRGVRAFIGANRTNFFNSLYGEVVSAQGTPLRQAMDDVGVYFSRVDDRGPWGATPGSTGGTQLACRQNYHILMTDGYWNASPARVGAARNNVDNAIGPTHTNGTTTFAYTPANPWKDTYSDTLADIAMYYWARDLRPDLPNKVFANATDNAFWQHVSVYGVALGVFGTIPSSTIQDAFASPYPAINWPDPNASNPAKIDDLAHAAVNSRGAFFSASDPDELATSLSAALENISARGSAGAPVGMGTANVVLGDNTMFASSYLPGLTWTGELGAYAMDLKTGVPSATPLWLAQAQLDARAPESRFIATYSGIAGPGQGIRFQPTTSGAATKLSAAQQALLNTPVSPPGLTDGAAVVEYLRGKRTREGDGTYRTRVHLLGDIVNAQPVVVRPPYFQYADAGYAAFKSAHVNRRQIVLQGANDGMMHAFDAGTALTGGVLGTPGTGAELWAYVPSLVLPALNNLSRRLGYTHKYYVDATPVVGDVDFNKTFGAVGAPDWRTIAVGGLGKGGRGYYALNLTDTLAVDEAAVASKVLWEFPNSATNATIKANIGFTFGKPIITKTRAHGWVVLVASGHNNGTDSGGDGKGYLFVLNARTGEVIRAIGTGIGATTTPSGLVYIAAYAEAASIDNTVEYVYGGDLLGNVWRFNLGDPVSSANWSVKALATLVDGSGIVQPVTTEPELAKVKVDGIDRRFVYVGTGLLLGDKDIPGAVGANPSATGTQTIYGLVDDLSEPAGATPVISPLRANLQQQTLTSADGGATRTASNTAVDFSAKKGWYVDLPIIGERINTPPALGAGALVFVSNVPSSDPCTLGGMSYFNVLEYRTGGFRAGSPVIGSGDPAAKSSVRFDTMASGVILAKLMSGMVVGATQLWDGNVAITTVPTGTTASVTRRRSWRELLQ